MIESLESRIAPAGVVAITLKAGLATITGDDAGNELAFAPGPNFGEIAVTGNDGETFTLNGQSVSAPVTLKDLTKPMKIDLRAGDDTLSASSVVFPVGINLQPGAGTDTATLTDTTIAGSLKILESEGNDELDVNGSAFRLGGSLEFTDRINSNRIFLTAASNEIQGNVKLISGATGISQYQLGGGSSVTSIGGSVLVKAAAQALAGYFDLEGARMEIAGDLSIDRPILSSGQSSDRFNADEIVIGGKLKLKYGASAHEFLVGNDHVDVFSVLKGMEVIKAPGNTANFGISCDDVVLGGVKATLGRFGELSISSPQSGGMNLLGPVNITGTGEVSIQGGGTLAGPVKIEGNEVVVGGVNSGDPLYVAGALSVTLAADGDATTSEFTLSRARIAAGVTLKGSGLQDNVTIDDVTMAAAFNANLGAGNDQVNMEQNGAFTDSSRFFAPVNLILGAGDDSLKISTNLSATTAVFYTRVLIDGGAGTDTVSTTGSYFPQGQPVMKNV